MNELKIFEHPKFGKIRTIVEDGKTLFCGLDAANALEYKNPSKALADHCKRTVERRANDSLGRQQNMKFITDGDLCRLAAKSEMPGADEFESWIFDEVVPAVLRNGGYVFGQESMTPEELMASALTVAQKVLSEREARLSTLEVEKLQLQAELDQSKEWYSIKRVACINGCSFRRFDWRKLKRESIAQGYGVKKIFDANYGEVNIYHMNVWEKVYPEAEL